MAKFISGSYVVAAPVGGDRVLQEYRNGRLIDAAPELAAGGARAALPQDVDAALKRQLGVDRAELRAIIGDVIGQELRRASGLVD